MTPAALAALTAVGAWYQAQDLRPPERDPRLDDAAAIVSQRAAEGAGGEEDLRFALRRAGVVDAEVLAVRGGGAASAAHDPGPRRRILAELDRLRGRAREMTHWGGGGADATVVFVRRMVRLDRPPPLKVDSGALELTGALAPGRSSLQAVISGPDGRVADIPVRRAAGDRFALRAPLTQGPGRYRVELLVEGPTVASLFTVWAGREAPAVPEVRVPPPFHSLGASLEAVRERAGAPPLRRLDALDAVALAHSADMARRGFFGHRSPDGTGPPERVAKSGVAAARVLENVATASHPGKAHMQVIDSPGHLRNMVDRQVTDYGIGVFEQAGVVYVTWLFAQLMPARPDPAPRRALRPGSARPRSPGGG